MCGRRRHRCSPTQAHTGSATRRRSPMGALKAAATPTATPAVTKSLLSLGLRKRLNMLMLKLRAGRQAGRGEMR